MLTFPDFSKKLFILTTDVPGSHRFGHRYLSVLRVCPVNVVEKPEEGRSPFCALVDHNVMSVCGNPSESREFCGSNHPRQLVFIYHCIEPYISAHLVAG